MIVVNLCAWFGLGAYLETIGYGITTLPCWIICGLVLLIEGTND